MITRRIVLAGAAALAFTASASAQDWKSKYPELTFAVVPAENASGVTERWTPFVAYLSKELGIKVTLRIANDYAAVIEGQRAGNIHIASYGSASFARARLTGVKTDAFANDINADGSTGYYSVFFVKASSPYKNIDQLKGKKKRQFKGRSYLTPLNQIDWDYEPTIYQAASVAHGTAYDIAGRGVADASSLVEAARVAVRLASSSAEKRDLTAT